MIRLVRYFSSASVICAIGESVGAEIETQFIDGERCAISVETSQLIIGDFVEKHRWNIADTKGLLITSITSSTGDRISYELGRHNIEFSSSPMSQDKIISHVRGQLEILYAIAEKYGAKPFFAPILDSKENLLVIPDKRDATWLALDGKDALNLLARTSAVQFTIDIPPENAIYCLNLLGTSINVFLSDYPQEALWREYIRKSNAGYEPSRYGGPIFFDNLNHYCRELVRHKMVSPDGRLVRFSEQKNPDVSLFLRSIWWYFRLRRYGEKMCIEVRPLARRTDDMLEEQLQSVMAILES